MKLSLTFRFKRFDKHIIRKHTLGGILLFVLFPNGVFDSNKNLIFGMLLEKRTTEDSIFFFFIAGLSHMDDSSAVFARYFILPLKFRKRKTIF